MPARSRRESPETLDRICGVLEIYQARRGYRFGMEALFLCGFVGGSYHRAVDLGCGSGVLALVLSRFGMVESIVGVEVQPKLADRARRSVERNRLGAMVDILEADLSQLAGVLPAGRFDLVVSNPPYGRIGSGREAPDRERALARQEILCTLPEVVAAAARLLRPRGAFAVLFPPLRLAEVLRACEDRGLAPQRLRFVQGSADLPPKNCLLMAVRGGKAALRVEPALVVYGPDGGYTEEVYRMLYPE